jgi:hypothetical protein
MAIGNPRIGQVIRYSFLWSNGHEKERPAVIVVAKKKIDNEKYRVAVMPITHLLPVDVNKYVAIPEKLNNYLGLDAEKSFVIIDEINEFEWTGFDIRKVPNTHKWEYGQIPPKFH